MFIHPSIIYTGLFLSGSREEKKSNFSNILEAVSKFKSQKCVRTFFVFYHELKQSSLKTFT